MSYWRTYQPKRCGDNNKDEDNSLKTLNDKNHQASSQKFGQLRGVLFVWLVQFLKKKKRDKSKFSWLTALFKHFFIKIQPNMSEQEKKRQRIYDLLDAETNPKKISEIIGVSLRPPSSSDLNLPWLRCMGRFIKQNKTNFPSKFWFPPQITIEEEWNKMSEEFIFMACKSFRRRVDTIIEKKKNGGHIK